MAETNAHIGGLNLFSEKYWARRQQRDMARGRYDSSEMNSCVCCGKKVNPRKVRWVCLYVEGGKTVISMDPSIQEGDEGIYGYLGLHPIGSSCRKGIPLKATLKYTDLGWGA